MNYIRESLATRKAQPGEAFYASWMKTPFIYHRFEAGASTSVCGDIAASMAMGTRWKEVPRGGELCPYCQERTVE